MIQGVRYFSNFSKIALEEIATLLERKDNKVFYYPEEIEKRYSMTVRGNFLDQNEDALKSYIEAAILSKKRKHRKPEKESNAAPPIEVQPEGPLTNYLF